MITPILLAAGASTRMGRPKALLDFDGRTCLEIALEAVRGLGAPILVLGPNREDLRSRVPLGGARIAVNDDVAGGPLASLKAGLTLLSADAEAFLFYPVDHPLVWPEEVRRLTDALPKEPGKSIVVPSHRMRRGHPVICRRPLAAEFAALPPGSSARAVLDRAPGRIAYVLFDEAYILMDMDTPEDYVRCLAAYRARRAEKP